MKRETVKPTEAGAVEGRGGQGSKIKICKDCLAEGRTAKPLPAPYPGPRCHRHHQAWRKVVKAAKGAKRAETTYGITDDDYRALLALQGGRCAWCRRRIGVNVRAAIDHDHSCPVCGGSGCRECVRGLLDRKCNEILGWFGDDPELIRLGADYLRNPPARLVLSVESV